MKKNIFFLLFFVVTACVPESQYPAELPEASKINTFESEGIMSEIFVDKNENIFRITSRDSTGKLCFSPIYGAAEIFILKKGNCITTSSYDENGKPMINALYGYSYSHIITNDDNYILEESYYDEKNRPIVPFDEDCAIKRFEYDENNNLIKTAVYDAGKKIILPVVTTEYDSRNLPVKISNMDGKGNPVLNGEGYAFMSSVYNERGLITEYSYCDENGNPAMVTNADNETVHAKAVFTYSDDDILIATAYFDADDKKIKTEEYD